MSVPRVVVVLCGQWPPSATDIHACSIAFGKLGGNGFVNFSAAHRTGFAIGYLVVDLDQKQIVARSMFPNPPSVIKGQRSQCRLGLQMEGSA